MFKMSIKSEGGKKGSKISCGVETNTVAVTLEHWTLAAVTLESVQKNLRSSTSPENWSLDQIGDNGWNSAKNLAVSDSRWHCTSGGKLG